MTEKFGKKHIVLFLISLFVISVLGFSLVKAISFVKSKDLNGKTLYVDESGIELCNYHNGRIVAKSSVGPGLLILKNCNDISLEINSNVYLLLDKKTSISDLYIKSNALVESLESFMMEQNSKLKIDSENKAFVDTIHIDEGYTPIIKNIDYNISKVNSTGKNQNKDSKKLNITLDDTFEGVGLRFLIENIPNGAKALYVVLVENGIERQIDWFSAKDDKNRFYSGFYDYRFLDAGKKYTFRFYYQGEKDRILEKFQISAVPNKGKSIKLDTSTAKIRINEKNGVISWESIPIAEMPEGTVLIYDMISYGKNQSWNFVGQGFISPANFDSINIYDEVRIYEPQNIYDNKVYLSVYFKYESYRWPILESEQFNVHFDY
ncbi:MAG: hypothetical protein MJ176_02565 [Treponema sp.]|nr:hypothetical protein [Treponema sp.]